MALPTASDNPFASLLITEGTEPSAPAAGKQRVYIDSTSHLLMATNSSGTERSIEGVWAAWTPTLTADSGNPNLGSTGTATGRFVQVGKVVHAYGKIEFKGTGVTAGTGVYEILLPVTAHASSIIGVMGAAYGYDDSAGLFRSLAAIPLDTGEFRLADFSTSLIVQNNVPWTWAANDQINFEITYEAA